MVYHGCGWCIKGEMLTREVVSYVVAHLYASLVMFLVDLPFELNSTILYRSSVIPFTLQRLLRASTVSSGEEHASVSESIRTFVDFLGSSRTIPSGVETPVRKYYYSVGNDDWLAPLPLACLKRCLGKACQVHSVDCKQQRILPGAKLESSQTVGTLEDRSKSSTGVCNMECEYEYEELIPGLPNEVAIEHISTKVPWGKLFSLNKSWRRAITSGQVHEARVRTNSTQLLVAMIHYNPSSVQTRFTTFENFEDIQLVLDQVISLYIPSANTWHQLPLIDGVETGIPHLCECVYLHGRLYIIGGCDEANGVVSSKEVYFLDLWSGKHKWIRCADMLQPREGFSSGVMGGKIYVFGGTACESDEAAETLPQAEVYDPINNVWSPLAPMLHSSAGDSPVIEEAFTLDGFFLVRCGFRDPHNTQKFVEIYNPEKDQWWKLERDINTFGPGTFMMTVAGNFYFFEYNNVVFYDFRTRCPTAQPNSLKVINETRELDNGHVFSAAPAGDGEVLALHYWPPSPRTGRTILLKSKGLGKPKCSLQWENLQCEYEFDSRYTRMCVVEI